MTIDQNKNIICGDGATASRNPLQKDDGTNIVVIGNNATGIGSETIAIGYKAKAEGEYSIAFGSSSYAFYGGVSIGDLTKTTYGAVAIGLRAQGSGRDSVAIGKDAAAEGQDSLAIAYSAKALAKNSVALGYMAKAAVEESIAIGYYSSAESKGSFAFGSNSKVTGVNSVAIGTGSEAKRDNSVSVGAGSGSHGPEYRQIINVAYGTADHDAATYGQILNNYAYSIKMDDNGSGSTTLKTNANQNGPTIQIDASALNKKITKNTNLITAVDNKIGSLSTDGTYIKKANNVSANLVELDKQVNTNATAITNKANLDLSNINAAGEDVIKNLAGNKAGEIVDVKLGNITSENYVKKADTVNANISALDKQMKANADNIGDTSKLTAAGLGSNLSDAVVNVNNKVGTADELKALKDAGLGDNLAQATAAVNKKADKNAADIKTVNGRVDELGGRVDTLGGAVSKLDTKVNKVGAGAAALAALHPMDFDPDNKLSFAAGVGSYHGASAVAIGAFYRPSEQVMFSISGNMGNGENMVNAGVSFALDRPSKTPTTKAALVKTVAAQNEQIAALKETVAEQKEIVAEQNEKIARLEAMVEKLAAKQST